MDIIPSKEVPWITDKMMEIYRLQDWNELNEYMEEFRSVVLEWSAARTVYINEMKDKQDAERN